MATTKLKLTVAAALAVLLIPVTVTVWQVNGYRLRNAGAATPPVRQNPAAAQAGDPPPRMWEVMYLTPESRRLEKLKELIKRGGDVNAPLGFDRMLNEGEKESDRKATAWALDVVLEQARVDKVDMIKLLLANGAKIHGKELAKAAFAGNQEESLAMVTALLEAGADANSRYNGFTALFWASQKGNKNSVKLLLAKPGLKLDETDPDGHTALMAAAEHGHREIVEMLLQAGANVRIANKHGETAATFAQKRLERQQAELQKQQAIVEKLRFTPQ